MSRLNLLLDIHIIAFKLIRRNGVPGADNPFFQARWIQGVVASVAVHR